MNWIQKATNKILESAGLEDARHHDTRRVVQTSMAELGIAPHLADVILNHSIKGAPKSRAHYDMYHNVPDKRDALTRWVQRLAEILGYDPNDVMRRERRGYQGKGPTRKLGRRETHHQRKARLAVQGLVLAPEHEDNRTVIPADRSTMSVTQAANTLGISRAAVHKAIKQERLAARWCGNVILVSRDAVLRYKQGRAEGGRKPPNAQVQAASGASARTALAAKGR